MKLDFRHYYFRWIKNLFFLFFFFTCLLTFARVAFAFYFGDLALLVQDLSGLKSAMFLGLRYDLMPLAYITILPFIILNAAYFIPGRFTVRVIRLLVVGVLCFGLFSLGWIYIFDYGFFSYFQDHINILFFGLFEDDTVAVLISIWKNYNVPVWISFILATHYIFYRFIQFHFSLFDFELKVRRFDWRMPVIFPIGLILLAFCGRGNFSRLPLSIEDAHISTNQFINKLSLNGAICLNRAIKIRKTYGKDNHNYLSQFKYQNWIQAFTDARGSKPSNTSLAKSLLSKTPNNPILANQPPHVVMVVMESFGSYWNDQDSDQFNILGKLKQHFKQGFLFRNFLPAENGTIGSVVSIATSQVIRPGARFLSESEFMNTKITSAGNLVYKKSGYTTHFIYGGKLGWRDLGKFLRAQGFDHLWGADEIKEVMPELSHLESKELGNEWGIFDEYLYAFIEEQLRTASTPQFFFVLTTSNHPPFEWPVSYAPMPVELTPERIDKLTVREELARRRFVAQQYANDKVGEFLTKVRSSTFQDQTVVALTGDHSFWIAKGVGLDQEFKRYSVPFFISVPDKLRPKIFNPNAFGSHEDIYPTLFNLTLSDQEYIKLGENLFAEDSVAINSSGLVANQFGAFHNNQYWKWKDIEKQILEPASETPELLKLKNHRQGLISITDLYLKEEKKGKHSDGESDQQ